MRTLCSRLCHSTCKSQGHKKWELLLVGFYRHVFNVICSHQHHRPSILPWKSGCCRINMVWVSCLGVLRIAHRQGGTGFSLMQAKLHQSDESNLVPLKCSISLLRNFGADMSHRYLKTVAHLQVLRQKGQARWWRQILTLSRVHLYLRHLRSRRTQVHAKWCVFNSLVLSLPN